MFTGVAVMMSQVITWDGRPGDGSGGSGGGRPGGGEIDLILEIREISAFMIDLLVILPMMAVRKA